MADGTLRPADVRRDLPELVALIEAVFTDDLGRQGRALRREFESMRRLIPVAAFLGRFVPALRHMFDGFVWEVDGRIVAMVTVQRAGGGGTRWLIGSLATQPEYRRRGIARRLVLQALDHARAHGARACVLDVRSDNDAAYALYRDLGFVHYDTFTDLRLDGLPAATARTLPANGLHPRPMAPTEWKARYELARRVTPAEVQAFAPVDPADYRVTAAGQLMTPLLLRLQRLAAHAWAIDQDGKLAGHTRLLASRTGQRPHGITLRADPAGGPMLAGALADAALANLAAYPRGTTLTSVRASEAALVQALIARGFTAIESRHRLGVRLHGPSEPETRS